MTNYLSIQYTEPVAPVEPVDLGEVKTWIVEDSTDNDELITSMIVGARQDIENWTNLFLVPKPVVVYAETTRDTDIIRLPYGMPSAVTIVGQDSGVDVALESDDYYMRGEYVIPVVGSYKIGYTAGATIPQALKEAIKMLVAYRYNNRGDQEKQQGIPEDIRYKIEKYVQQWL